jgi:predicted nucleic acid-binding Zn finger protein
MPSKIVNAKKVHKKSKTHTVNELHPNTYQVTSGSSGKSYVVRGHTNENQIGRNTYVTYTCSCPWGKYRSNKNAGRSGCSHVQSVAAHLEKERAGRTISAWSNEDDAKRQHRPQIVLGDGVTLTTRAAGS